MSDARQGFTAAAEAALTASDGARASIAVDGLAYDVWLDDDGRIVGECRGLAPAQEPAGGSAGEPEPNQAVTGDGAGTEPAAQPQG